MKVSLALTLLIVMVTFSSCELVGDIFQVGFYTALIVIALVVILVLWLVNRFRRRR